MVRGPSSSLLLVGGCLALVVGVAVHLVNGLAEPGVLAVILVCTVTVRANRRGRQEPSSARSP
jgi:hypothetical protein